MPEIRGNPQPAAVVLDQTISWNRIQWYWRCCSPDRFTLRAENYSCLQTTRVQPLFQPTFQPTFLWFYPPQAKFHHHMFGGWRWFPLLSYSDLQSDIFCALCLHWKKRWTDKNKKKTNLRKRETSQRESSASRCGIWIRLYPGIQYRNISCYRAQRAL